LRTMCRIFLNSCSMLEHQMSWMPYSGTDVAPGMASHFWWCPQLWLKQKTTTVTTACVWT